MNWLNGRCCQKMVAFTATGWATLWQAAAARGQDVPPQSGGAAAVTPMSGTDFILPAFVVIFLFGVSIFAVCRSSRRV
ncbi:hypothetical protein Pan258_60580 [Symmachiella dynata]|uniref:hypothetical protein n=1 Tax=Symmachiella dynata TaxID=2527995 RepID=UPI00118D062F|nr:hypothetical protein [Symmachiella dynata]QDT51961.1 hypothetical protein Pan258_60580 [Symmachiella dynata]